MTRLLVLLMVASQGHQRTRRTGCKRSAWCSIFRTTPRNVLSYVTHLHEDPLVSSPMPHTPVRRDCRARTRDHPGWSHLFQALFLYPRPHSRGSRTQGGHCFVLHQNSHTSSRLTATSTCTPSLSTTLSSSPALHPFLSEPESSADPRCNLGGGLAEPPSITGCEPKPFAEHEDLREKSLFLHQPSIASTYDSAESIVTGLGLGR